MHHCDAFINQKLDANYIEGYEDGMFPDLFEFIPHIFLVLIW